MAYFGPNIEHLLDPESIVVRLNLIPGSTQKGAQNGVFGAIWGYFGAYLGHVLGPDSIVVRLNLIPGPLRNESKMGYSGRVGFIIFKEKSPKSQLGVQFCNETRDPGIGHFDPFLTHFGPKLVHFWVRNGDETGCQSDPG